VKTKGKYLFTSESVTEGHPDKVCDKISDAILDAALKDDKKAHVACEALATRGVVFVGGEITTSTYIDIPKTIRNVIKDIGYTKPEYGFCWKDVGVVTAISEQSPDIADKVPVGGGEEQGAGDQGLMFGYATTETDTLMPTAIYYASKLAKQLADIRKQKVVDYLRPDGKTQVTFEFIDGKPVRLKNVVISTQHDPDVEMAKLQEDLKEHVVHKIIPSEFLTSETEYFINHVGKFVLGGPQADAGLTGRKIIVDTYGGVGSHGGGCFSGKDPSKVDRSGSYMARYVAKNIVASGLATECEVQIAYCIGVPEPVSVYVNSHGTGNDEEIQRKILQEFDLRPAKIIERLNLLHPQYIKTAAYGHFGREDQGFAWEKKDVNF